MDQKTPDKNDRLNISARWVEIWFVYSFRSLVGRLFGPVDLPFVSEGIMKFTSCASIAATNNNSSLGWWRKSWNENFILTLAFLFLIILFAFLSLLKGDFFWMMYLLNSVFFKEIFEELHLSIIPFWILTSIYWVFK